MRKLNQILVSLIFLILISLKCSSFAKAKELVSNNVSVIDGDTILINNYKIRFSGIDAPESYFRGKKQVCFQNTKKILCGEEAKKKLVEKIGKSLAINTILNHQMTLLIFIRICQKLWKTTIIFHLDLIIS